ncbi:MAG: catalase [Candidatus Fermentibacteraceae bacterium]|nr:catalase [Candidatus Fermentibacteraceae bacterium]
MKKDKKFTTSSGIPVENDLSSITAGNKGPVLLQDVHLLEKLAHFTRERIPERVVHAKGAGAFGYFEVTDDLSRYTCASFLSEVGKRTEVFARFSTVGGEKGSADTERDPRGFAVKFYTEEGNFDMVGNNTPVFFIRDAMKFPDFIHTQKRDPETNLKDPDMFWDFLSLTPESIHQVTILFSDRGTPKGHRHMNGYGGHAYMWYNEKGDYNWVKLHFKTEQGIVNFTGEDAGMMRGIDPDFSTRDLFESIAGGNFPSWSVEVQIMTPKQAEGFRFDPFDVTKVWPHGEYPMIKLGRMVLDRNPENYFADVEQAAFSPGNLVPGMGPSFDRMFQARIFAYPDTHRHRLGANYHLIPVNQPRGLKVSNYQRDGSMRVDGNGGPGPNYWPNSFGGVDPDGSRAVPPLDVTGTAWRHEVKLSDEDFVQAGDLYRKVMDDSARENLVRNIVGHLGNAQKRIQLRQTALFWKADEEYGRRVADGLGLDVRRIGELASMSQEERVRATSDR